MGAANFGGAGMAAFAATRNSTSSNKGGRGNKNDEPDYAKQMAIALGIVAGIGLIICIISFLS